MAHNLGHDLPYTGISIGWEWNDNPTLCRENVVEFNHVHGVMRRLRDGGCIYTLGLQPGTVIRGNHMHDVHRSFMAQGTKQRPTLDGRNAQPTWSNFWDQLRHGVCPHFLVRPAGVRLPAAPCCLRLNCSVSIEAV